MEPHDLSKLPKEILIKIILDREKLFEPDTNKRIRKWIYEASEKIGHPMNHMCGKCFEDCNWEDKDRCIHCKQSKCGKCMFTVNVCLECSAKDIKCPFCDSNCKIFTDCISCWKVCCKKYIVPGRGRGTGTYCEWCYEKYR